jgi:hypothetical protein
MSSTSLIFRRYWSWLVWSLRAFPRHSGSSTSGPPPPMRIYSLSRSHFSLDSYSSLVKDST